MAAKRNLLDLVGESISEIAFVMDYVELRANGPILRAISHPAVSDGTTTLTFPEPGSRDALCGLIGSQITEARWTDEGTRIQLQTDRGQRFTIPLGEDERVGPEAAHFVPTDEAGELDIRNMMIW